MGQQQLLLIVLGIIIVGVAVASGIGIVTSTAEQANRDALMSDLIQLSSMARAHYSRPEALGGGGRSYGHFKIPASLAETDNGTIEHTQTSHGTDHFHFTATGTALGKDGEEPVQVSARVTINSITFKEIN